MRQTLVLLVAIAIGTMSGNANANSPELTGEYLEARTCQVYTGPCFAAGEVGLAGKEAVMAWKFKSGSFAGENLAGLCLVAVVQTGKTLGFSGIESHAALRTRLLIDDRATARQQAALLEFLRTRNPKVHQSVADVQRRKIEWEFDTADLRCHLQAGRLVTLTTRKANPDDCICSNESAYYPPLTEVEHFVPGVATEFSARGLQRSWQTSDTRNAYMATFRLDPSSSVAQSDP